MAGDRVRTASKVALVSIILRAMVFFPACVERSEPVGACSLHPPTCAMHGARIHVVAQQAPVGSTTSLVQHPTVSSSDGPGSSESTV